MIAYLLYTKGSPAERTVRHYGEELSKFKIDNEVIEADSVHGLELTEIYDLLSRPALALVRDDGSVVQAWQGELPPVTDVSYLVHQS